MLSYIKKLDIFETVLVSEEKAHKVYEKITTASLKKVPRLFVTVLVISL